ncbi:MAG: hypothetical protein ACLTKI_08180, partial [Lachnospiraceae bacterium]
MTKNTKNATHRPGWPDGGKLGKPSKSDDGRFDTGHSGIGKSDQPSLFTRFYPMIRQRSEVLEEIHQSHPMTSQFYSWNLERREEFLDICSGNKGLKILYDGFFKEILNPEVRPERLNSLLTQVLGYPVTIQIVYPNDSVRLGDTTLIYTDLLVQLEDGSLANVEIQKIGYAFP